MQIAATLGMAGSDGSGRMPLAHRARTLPSVSLPSSVVRSIIRIARSSAHSFDSLLIERSLERVDSLLDAHLIDATNALYGRLDTLRAADPRADEGVCLGCRRPTCGRHDGIEDACHAVDLTLSSCISRPMRRTCLDMPLRKVTITHMTRKSRDTVGQTLRALSDPIRRALFEAALAEPGITTSQLAQRTPSMSRWGVIKHLAVLREAGLIQTLPSGRLRRHYPERAALEPLRGWLAST